MGSDAKVAYFTQDEISRHNCESDIWVSLLNRVYNLTGLVQKYKGLYFCCGCMLDPIAILMAFLHGADTEQGILS